MDICLGLFALSGCAIAALWVKVRDLRFRVEGLERELDATQKVVCTDDEIDDIRWYGLFGRYPEEEGFRRFPTGESQIDAFGRWIENLPLTSRAFYIEDHSPLDFEAEEICRQVARDDLHKKRQAITARVVFDDKSVGQLRFVRNSTDDRTNERSD